MWCSLLTNEPELIFKHCPTRWLSLLRCVDCYINNLEGLKSDFCSSHEETSKIRSILKRLENPLLKPLLYFLSYVMTPQARRQLARSGAAAHAHTYVRRHTLSDLNVAAVPHYHYDTLLAIPLYLNLIVT